MQENSNQFLIQEALRLANTPTGQQLLAILQKNGGSDLNDAMNRAASGDYGQAKQALSALLKDPETKKLLRQLGGE